MIGWINRKIIGGHNPDTIRSKQFCETLTDPAKTHDTHRRAMQVTRGPAQKFAPALRLQKVWQSTQYRTDETHRMFGHLIGQHARCA